jgi:hypothetical protein
MSERPRTKQVLDLYLRHVICEARVASDDLRGSFLIQTGYRGKYIIVHILFVCDTDRLEVEDEIDVWFKIYRWIEEKKDDLLHRYKIEENNMIILYPRFISSKEYWSLHRQEKAFLEKNKIAWYKQFDSII